MKCRLILCPRRIAQEEVNRGRQGRVQSAVPKESRLYQRYSCLRRTWAHLRHDVLRQIPCDRFVAFGEVVLCVKQGNIGIVGRWYARCSVSNLSRGFLVAGIQEQVQQRRTKVSTQVQRQGRETA